MLLAAPLVAAPLLAAVLLAVPPSARAADAPSQVGDTTSQTWEAPSQDGAAPSQDGAAPSQAPDAPPRQGNAASHARDATSRVARPSPEVEATLRGNAVDVTVSAALQAPPALVWDTITDYERQVDWIPGLAHSRVLGRSGGTLWLEQIGVLRLLVFRFRLRARVQVEERPPLAVEVRLVEGDLRRLEGGYRIEPGEAPDRPTVLRWAGTVEPRVPLPGFLTRAVARRLLREQFQGVIDEIGRRAAAAESAR